MSVSIADFWKLIADSRLLAPEQVQQLAADFAQVKGAEHGNAKSLAQWLVSRNALSRYQATVLLAGRSGPFFYGDYRVYDRVDQGPMKGQFRAIHVPSGHPVMLRFLAGSVLTDTRQWAEVAARVVKQAGVINPLLQRYYEPVDLQAFRFLSTEDVRGDSLEDLMARHGRVPPPEAARIIRLVAFALAHLHQLGLAHGDVRPGQIILEPSGNIKLLIDAAYPAGALNVAAIDPQSLEAQRLDYAAPEMMAAGKTPDIHTDIYALGCTFYHLLAGQPPFPGGLPAQKLTRHASEHIQPLEPYGVPYPMAQLVAFLMAKRPDVRPAQASLLAEQLAPFIDPARLQIPAQAPPPTLATYEQWIRQKQAALANASNAKAAAPNPQLPKIEIGEKREAAGGVPITPAPTTSTAARIHKRPSKKQTTNLLIGGGVAVVAALVLLVLVLSGGGDSEGELVADAGNGEGTVDTRPVSSDNGSVVPPNGEKQPTPPTPGAPKSPGDNETQGPQTVAAADQPQYEIKPDDGQLLWASPTAGPAITFDNVPPNAQIYLIARPAEILASPGGALSLEALGPTFAQHRDAWEKSAGVKLGDVRQVIMSLHDNQGKMPRPSFRVTLTTPAKEADLVSRWGNPAKKEVDGTPYYEAGDRAYYIPASEQGAMFVMGHPLDIKEVAATKGAPPVMRREVEQLRRLTDVERHLTVLLAPNYLFTDGREIFTGPYEKLLKPLDWFIGDGVKASSSSLHFGEPFYAEMRMISEIGIEKRELASALRDRLEEIPTRVEDYIVSLNPPMYWKKVALRYPQMIRYLHQHTRVGVEDDVAIVNAVGPSQSAHNLFFGGELALMSTPGATVAVADAGSGKPLPKTLDELLKHKITFEVPRNDLNLVMADLETEIRTDLPGLTVPFSIKILGKDLEAEGITRNQSVVNFKMESSSIADILTGLVFKANPITTVKDPSEVDQKLIWVVGPDPDQADRQVVLITTRKAAEAKGYKLPAPFVPKS